MRQSGGGTPGREPCAPGRRAQSAAEGGSPVLGRGPRALLGAGPARLLLASPLRGCPLPSPGLRHRVAGRIVEKGKRGRREEEELGKGDWLGEV